MSLSKIRSRKQKGFTFIELMIVIAVIAILAAVLIPNATKFKESAKEAGIEANARIAQGLTESIINKVESTNFPDWLVAKIGTDTDSVFENPITGNKGVRKITAVGDLPDTARAAYVSTTVAPIAPASDTERAKVKGAIWLQVKSVYKKVEITPYDRNGNKMEPITVEK